MRIFQVALSLALWSLLAFPAPVAPVAAVTVGDNATLVQDVTIRSDGRLFVDGVASRKPKIELTDSRTIFRYKVVDQPKTLYQDVLVRVNLPFGVTTEQVKPTFYAVHSVSEYHTKVTGDSQLEFQASYVGTDATLTIVIELPKGALSLSVFQRVAVALDGLPLGAWLVIAIVVPLLMLLFALYLVIQRLRDIQLKPFIKKVTDRPSTLPPAFVGTLLRGYVGEREIAATLVDLAHRGYIDIIYSEQAGFSFSRKRDWTTDQTLLPFERLFLDQLVSNNLIAGAADITSRLNAHIWSDTVTAAVDSVYEQMSSLGYFQGNPQQSHLAIRATGVTIFFLSIAGLALSLLYVDQQPLIVLPWIVSLAVTPFMIRLSLLVPHRTPAGRDAASRWLGYRNYLQTVAIDYSDQLDAYEQYLALAIALGVEREWTAHFTGQPCRVPDWFFSQGAYIDSYPKLVNLVFKIVGQISQKFSFARKPTAV